MKKKLSISTIPSLITAILFLLAGIFYVVYVCFNWNAMALISGIVDFACASCWFFIFVMKRKQDLQ